MLIDLLIDGHLENSHGIDDKWLMAEISLKHELPNLWGNFVRKFRALKMTLWLNSRDML